MGIFKTPLRYPGGKQRLAPFIYEILEKNQITEHYVEPYAGGAGVGLDLLLNKKIKYIHLNDSDIGIYAFWHSVIHYNEKLCYKILTASLTVNEWKYRKKIVADSNDSDLFELGFSTFYLNRCNHSGILLGGLIGGLKQQGNYKMDVRFSRNDLIRRIEAIGSVKRKISISNMDAELYIDTYIQNLPLNTLVYLDPPYFNKSKNLYANHYQKEHHTQLANAIQNRLKHSWILSYDDVPEILRLYQERKYFLYKLQYNARRVYKGNEVFVFSDDVELPFTSSLKNVDAGMRLLKMPNELFNFNNVIGR